jgi:hypothetical protein
MANNQEREDAHRTSAIVVALFMDPSDAEQALTDLREAGFAEDDVGVAVHDPARRETTGETSGDSAGEGAAKGALSGGIVGGTLGLLGSLLIPGVGLIMAGGILGSILAGAGIGAATGGLIGALVSMGISPEEAEHFERGFREGGVLVTVKADERAMEARAILRDRSGDLGPSFAASDLLDSQSAGAIEVEESGPELPREGKERRSQANLSYSGPERRAGPF